jgi:hypothetical protein
MLLDSLSAEGSQRSILIQLCGIGRLENSQSANLRRYSYRGAGFPIRRDQAHPITIRSLFDPPDNVLETNSRPLYEPGA